MVGKRIIYDHFFRCFFVGWIGLGLRRLTVPILLIVLNVFLANIYPNKVGTRYIANTHHCVVPEPFWEFTRRKNPKKAYVTITSSATRRSSGYWGKEGARSATEGDGTTRAQHDDKIIYRLRAVPVTRFEKIAPTFRCFRRYSVTGNYICAPCTGNVHLGLKEH